MFVDVEKIRAMAERVAKSEGIAWVDVEVKGGRSKALVSGTLYFGTAILLAIGAYAAYLPQHRL